MAGETHRALESTGRRERMGAQPSMSVVSVEGGVVVIDPNFVYEVVTSDAEIRRPSPDSPQGPRGRDPRIHEEPHAFLLAQNPLKPVWRAEAFKTAFRLECTKFSIDLLCRPPHQLLLRDSHPCQREPVRIGAGSLRGRRKVATKRRLSPGEGRHESNSKRFCRRG